MQALMVLARALEEHPKSVLLWIVYLYIYYSNQKSIGKDDMYHYAVRTGCLSFFQYYIIKDRNLILCRLIY